MNDTASVINSRVTIENLIGAIQNLFASILAVGGILSAGGFIVVNTYLSQFTSIQGFNIDPRQYLAAGVGLLFPIGLAALVIFVFDTFGRLYGLRLSRITAQAENAKRITTIEKSVAQKILPKSPETKKRLIRARFWILVVGLIYYTIFFGILYGQYVYGSLPRFLGGGKPEPMILIFNDPELPTLFDLTADTWQPRRTQTVMLLAELDDGLLVIDIKTGRVAAVKNQTLTGLMNAAPIQQTLISAPIATSAPTLMP